MGAGLESVDRGPPHGCRLPQGLSWVRPGAPPPLLCPVSTSAVHSFDALAPPYLSHSTFSHILPPRTCPPLPIITAFVSLLPQACDSYPQYPPPHPHPIPSLPPQVGGQEHFYLETQAACVIPQENDEYLIISSTQVWTLVWEGAAAAAADIGRNCV